MTKVFITSEITKIHCDEKLSSNSGMFFGPTPATISCPRLSNQSRTTNVNPHAQTKLFLCINLLERERESSQEPGLAMEGGVSSIAGKEEPKRLH